MRADFPPVRIAEFVLLLVTTLTYLVTLDNGLQPYELLGGDLITHHYAHVQARFANAPGYPLYSMGGWLWFQTLYFFADSFQSLFQGGAENRAVNPIPLLSSYSTLWAIPAIWLLYRLLLRFTTTAHRPLGNWPVAWSLSAFFAATYFFWYYATTSEQYSSAVAQTLAILYVYCLWSDRVAGATAGSTAATGLESRIVGANGLLYWLAFLCGISLAHMLTVAFIVPPLVLMVLHQAPGLLRSLPTILKAVGAAFVPLLSYLFVYIRGAQHPDWRGAGQWESTWAWFWDFVGTDQGRDELSWGLDPSAPFFGGGFPELMWQELSIPLLVYGLVGIAWLPRRIAFIIYSTLIIYMGFCWAYRLGNWFQVIIPAYPLILLGIAGLVSRWEPWSVRRASLRLLGGHSPMQIAVVGLLLFAVAWRVQASLPEADSRNRPEDTGLDRAAILLDQPLPHSAALFAALENAQALQYLTQIWKIRPDLQVIGSDQARGFLESAVPLFATWQTVDLLLTEMDVSQPLEIHAHSPDWFQIRLAVLADAGSINPGQSADAIRSSLHGGHPAAVFTRIDQRLSDMVYLHGYRAEPAPTGTPVHSGQLPTLNNLNEFSGGFDLTLFWAIDPSHHSAEDASPVWQEGLGISIRPLGTDGYFEPPPLRAAPDNNAESEPPVDPYIKVDRAMPASSAILARISSHQANLNLAIAPIAQTPDAESPALLTFADPYRFQLTPQQLETLAGFELILYRVVEDGFENIAVEQFPLSPAAQYSHP